jgi:hypothetical protein
MPAFQWTAAQLLRNPLLRHNSLGEVDNRQQGVEKWVGEEKANSKMLRFCRLAMNYGR